MKYTITGTVHHVGPVETIGAKGFTKRTFTIAEEGKSKFPNNIPFELHKEDAERAPAPGDKIEAEFYLQGREWQGRFFLSAKCVDWQLVGKAEQQPAPVPPPSQPAAKDEGEDRLPF